MKNYDQTIESVFERIENYNTLKRKRTEAAKKAVIPLCCICLAVLIGSVIRNDLSHMPIEDSTGEISAQHPESSSAENGDESSQHSSPESSLESDAASAESSTDEPSQTDGTEVSQSINVEASGGNQGEDSKNGKSEVSQNSVEEHSRTSESESSQTGVPETSQSVVDNIVFVDAEEFPSADRMYIALMRDDRIPLSSAELNVYYGINVFPDNIPNDLMLHSEYFSIYRRNKGKGEVYHDGNVIRYLNENSTRGVAINVDKNGMPFDFCNIFADVNSFSVINGTKVGFAKKDGGENLLAEFTYKNVGFRIFASGLTQDELVEIVRSLLVK